ncbi:MAG TPA: chemotaxis protein CheD [Geobacteraceae bacterium]|nr:chemotaxis protein CheD [Geobacteraceae bacterium]
MNRADERDRKVFLKPGESYFAERPTVVATVLGSCVSVTMFSAERHCGAICHAVLPEENAPGEACRYVDASIMDMLRFFDRRRIKRSQIEVKLFGGSNILPASDVSRGRGASVGSQNIETALRIIEREQLRLVASDVGGDQGRKILFHTDTGEILLKRLGKIKRD